MHYPIPMARDETARPTAARHRLTATHPGKSVGLQLVLLCVLCCAEPASAVAVFTPLGIGNQVQDISGDGSTVVGFTGSGNGTRAWRWTAETGRQVLFDDTGGFLRSRANAVSYDGSVIVGQRAVASGLSSSHAFRWTESGGMVSIGDLPGGFVNASAFGVSGDGSVVVGGGVQSPSAGGPTAFRWTGGNMQPLNDFTRTAFDVSADGSKSVGQALIGSGFVGFSASGNAVDEVFAGLGQSPENTVASAISADGSTIVGFGINAAGEQLAWRSNGSGFEPLGDLLFGGVGSYATDVSADGSVIVGGSEGGNGNEAFVLDPTNGMYSLRDSFLVDGIVGSDGGYLTDWTLTEAVAVSDDGNVIVGRGVNPDGLEESWMAHLNVAQSIYLNWSDPISADLKVIDDPVFGGQTVIPDSRSGATEDPLQWDSTIGAGADTYTVDEYRDLAKLTMEKRFRDAGVKIDVFDSREDKKPTVGALEVRFGAPIQYTDEDGTVNTLGGLAWDIAPTGTYGHIDQFNKRLDGEVAVLLDVAGIFVDSPETAGNLIAHEAGHALGLFHVCAEITCTADIMDYGTSSGDEQFLNNISQATEPPSIIGDAIENRTQNPVYHLQTYASDLANPERVSSDASPGSLDNGQVIVWEITPESLQYAGTLANLTVQGVHGSNAHGFESHGINIEYFPEFNPVNASELKFDVYGDSEFRVSATAVPATGGGGEGEGGGPGEGFGEGEGEGGPPPPPAIPDRWDLYFGTGDVLNPNFVFNIDPLQTDIAGSIFRLQGDGSFEIVGAFVFNVRQSITFFGEPPPAVSSGAVAEPGTAALLLGATGLLGFWPRRRRG